MTLWFTSWATTIRHTLSPATAGLFSVDLAQREEAYRIVFSRPVCNASK